MLRSTDGGLTWSTPFQVPVNSPHGPVQLADGRLLYAGKALWDGTNRVGVCHSRDDGRTWQWLADIPTRPGDSRTDYHELHAVDAGEGRLLLHIRNHAAPNVGGPPKRIVRRRRNLVHPSPHQVWGLPSHLLRLRDGRTHVL